MNLSRLLHVVAAAVLTLSAASAPAADVIVEGTLSKGVRTFELAVTEDGFVPSRLKVERGETVRLVITRKVKATCATEIVVKGKGIEAPLPLNTAVKVEFKADRSGEIAFGCAMNMITGVVFVR